MLLCWASNLVGLPGNWFGLLAAGLYAWLMPEHRSDFGWFVVILLLALAILGEIVEAVAGAAGSARAGGSRRSALLAMLGSTAGGLAGLFVGLPVPVVGPLMTALLLSAVGALLGAMVGEAWVGRELHEGWAVGHAAFWGRLLGTFGKVLVGCVMIVVVAVAVVI
jgi:uncharacterized protein YqgC (DUF456 family)